MEDSDVVLRLTIDDALLLSTLLDNTRAECFVGGLAGNFTGQTAARMLNSAIDPIIEQLEEELELLGVN